MKYLLIIIFAALMSCSNDTTGPNENQDPATQVDSTSINEYSTIQIGNQIWLAENFRTTLAADGSLLQGICAYDNNEDYVEEYGRLYTWQAAQDACPPGWHLPSENEWNILIAAVGSDPGNKLKVGGNSGFNALLGGRKSGDDFDYIGELGLYWTVTTDNPEHAFQKLFIGNQSDIITDQTPITGGLSVRYIRD